MKTLTTILIVMGAIIVALLVLALFMKKNYAVEREITINQPKAEIFNYVKFLKNQNKYSAWAKIDPNMKNEYRGEDGAVGFVSAWFSDNKEVGVGEQEITAISPDRIDYEIRFSKPFSSVSPVYISFTDVSPNSTLIKWGFEGHMNYPSNLMLLFMNMEKVIGNDLSTGLENLKKILEKD